MPIAPQSSCLLPHPRLDTHTLLSRCSFCACLVQGYQLLESRQVYEHMMALEDEGAGLRAQLKRFSRRVSCMQVAVAPGSSGPVTRVACALADKKPPLSQNTACMLFQYSERVLAKRIRNPYNIVSACSPLHRCLSDAGSRPCRHKRRSKNRRSACQGRNTGPQHRTEGFGRAVSPSDPFPSGVTTRG